MPMSPRLLRPRQAGGFDPRKISGIYAWWDFADLSTLKQNSDGTVAVTALNDPVGFVSDKSSNGYNLTQPTNNDRPLASPTAKNNRNCLLFDGTDDGLVTADGLPNLGALTMIAVFNASGWGATNQGYLVERGTAIRGFRLNSAGFIQAFVNNTEAGRSTVSSVALSQWYYAGTTWDGGTASASAVAMRVNGVSSNTISATLGTGADTQPLVVGRRGAAASNSRNFNGLIGEVVVYDKALSALELGALEAYLKSKWAL